MEKKNKYTRQYIRCLYGLTIIKVSPLTDVLRKLHFASIRLLEVRILRRIRSQGLFKAALGMPLAPANLSWLWSVASSNVGNSATNNLLLLNLVLNILGFFVFVLHLFVFLIIHKLRAGIAVRIIDYVSGSPGSSSTSSLSTTTDFKSKEQLKQSSLARDFRIRMRMRLFYHDFAMIFNKMEFFFSINLCNLSTNVHLT